MGFPTCEFRTKKRQSFWELRDTRGLQGDYGGSLLRTLRSFWWETFTFCRDEQGRMWIMNEGISRMV